MPDPVQTTFLFVPECPSLIVLPQDELEALRELVARLLLQAIRRQETDKVDDEKRK